MSEVKARVWVEFQHGGDVCRYCRFHEKGNCDIYGPLVYHLNLGDDAETTPYVSTRHEDCVAEAIPVIAQEWPYGSIPGDRPISIVDAQPEEDPAR